MYWMTRLPLLVVLATALLLPTGAEASGRQHHASGAAHRRTSARALVLDPDWVGRLRAALPELPGKKQARFVADYGLSAAEAGAWE